MDITIYPTKLHGIVNAIPSKSHAHRLLICSAFSDNDTTLECPEVNEDIEATVRCLKALGATINHTCTGYHITPIHTVPMSAEMDCGESGSTLRFILPIICALGVNATIHMSGRLPNRPLSPLWEELTRMGCTLSRPAENTICTSGRLMPGVYTIAGNISSQFITGLLFALALIDGESKINITGRLESRPYVMMTLEVLSIFGIKAEDYRIQGSFPFHSPGNIKVEGDWSNGAFFLTAAALGNEITMTNLVSTSHQGDRAITNLLNPNVTSTKISAMDIPDLIPILSVYYAVNGGAVFTDIARLRLKESDRVASVSGMLQALGIHSISTESTLTVKSGQFTSGTVNACGDHRIAMATAIAATVANGPVTILGAECVAKSYPSFWDEYKRLGGKYEQHIW